MQIALHGCYDDLTLSTMNLSTSCHYAMTIVSTPLSHFVIPRDPIVSSHKRNLFVFDSIEVRFI